MDGTERDRRFAVWLEERLGDRTQGQMAEYVGVAKSTVNRWLGGNSWPERRNLRKLAAYLKVEPAEIEALLPDDTPRHSKQAHWPFVRRRTDGASVMNTPAGDTARLGVEFAYALLRGEPDEAVLAYMRRFVDEVNAAHAAQEGRGDTTGGDPAGPTDQE